MGSLPKKQDSAHAIALDQTGSAWAPKMCKVDPLIMCR